MLKKLERNIPESKDHDKIEVNKNGNKASELAPLDWQKSTMGPKSLVSTLYERLSKRNWNYFLKALCFDISYKTTLPPSKYSPLQLIHLSHQCFHCLKHFLKSSLKMTDSSFLIFFLTSPILSNWCPFMPLFMRVNKKKSQGARSGK